MATSTSVAKPKPIGEVKVQEMDVKRFTENLSQDPETLSEDEQRQMAKIIWEISEGRGKAEYIEAAKKGSEGMVKFQLFLNDQPHLEFNPDRKHHGSYSVEKFPGAGTPPFTNPPCPPEWIKLIEKYWNDMTDGMRNRLLRAPKITEHLMMQVVRTPELTGIREELQKAGVHQDALRHLVSNHWCHMNEKEHEPRTGPLTEHPGYPEQIWKQEESLWKRSELQHRIMKELPEAVKKADEYVDETGRKWVETERFKKGPDGKEIPAARDAHLQELKCEILMTEHLISMTRELRAIHMEISQFIHPQMRVLIASNWNNLSDGIKGEIRQHKLDKKHYHLEEHVRLRVIALEKLSVEDANALVANKSLTDEHREAIAANWHLIDASQKSSFKSGGSLQVEVMRSFRFGAFSNTADWGCFFKIKIIEGSTAGDAVIGEKIKSYGVQEGHTQLAKDKLQLISDQDRIVSRELEKSQQSMTDLLMKKNKEFDEFIRKLPGKHQEMNKAIETYLKCLYAELDMKVLLEFDIAPLLAQQGEQLQKHESVLLSILAPFIREIKNHLAGAVPKYRIELEEYFRYKLWEEYRRRFESGFQHREVWIKEGDTTIETIEFFKGKFYEARAEAKREMCVWDAERTEWLYEREQWKLDYIQWEYDRNNWREQERHLREQHRMEIEATVQEREVLRKKLDEALQSLETCKKKIKILQTERDALMAKLDGYEVWKSNRIDELTKTVAELEFELRKYVKTTILTQGTVPEPPAMVPNPEFDHPELKPGYANNEEELKREFKDSLHKFVNDALKQGDEVSKRIELKKELLAKNFNATATYFQQTLADMEAQNSKNMAELAQFNQFMHGIHGTMADFTESRATDDKVHVSAYFAEEKSEHKQGKNAPTAKERDSERKKMQKFDKNVKETVVGTDMRPPAKHIDQ